jgi:deazaflavin-dependent oxidoreductase (nitroreductase family)
MDHNTAIITEFRANHGRVGGPFAGMNLLLLTHTGAKSGRSYTTPLAYTRDGDHFVIIASKGGAPNHPDWYYNLLAHPDVQVEIGDDTFPVHAAATSGTERRRLYDQQAAQYPVFKEYEAKTTREIPVFVLSRR